MIELIHDSDFILPNFEQNPQHAVGEDDIDKPLVFRLYYNNGGQVENTIYLNDSDPLDLSLELYTLSDKNITFKALQGQPTPTATQKRSHFYLKFAKQLEVDFNQVQVAPSDTWQVNKQEVGQNVFMFFRRKSELHLNRNDRVLLTLKNFTVNNPTVKSTDLTLYYGEHSNLLLVNNQKLDKEINLLKGVTVMKKPPSIYTNNIPLEGRFLGHDTILNDGNTPNQLTLRIFNRPLSAAATSPILLLKPAQSRFIISFETGDNSDALTTSTDANRVTIKAKEENRWEVDPRSNQWTVTPKVSETLPPNMGFDLEISGLKTNKASGVSYLYIDYENIGDYPAGRLVVPIEKTPLLYRDRQVGIGTNTPDAKLHIGKVTEDQVGLKVEGPSAKIVTTKKEILRFVRPAVSNQVSEDKVSFKLGKFEGNSNGKAQLDIALKDVTVMSLREDGKVGIGTTAPSVKLHVQGDIRLSGNIQGGSDRKLGIYTKTDSGNSRAWIEMWGEDTVRPGELTLGATYIDFRPNSTSSYAGDSHMRLTSEGKLGIGTINPSAKLHVSGDAIVSGKLAIGTTVSNTIHLTIGDNDTGLKQEGENKLAIYTNNAERVRIDNDGKVGIGTTNPAGKLDVNGDFYIKGQKPIDYRTYKVSKFLDLAINNTRESILINTAYSASNWFAIIGGISSRNANSGGLGIVALPIIINDIWHFKCDTVNVQEFDWIILGLFIKKEMVQTYPLADL